MEKVPDTAISPNPEVKLPSSLNVITQSRSFAVNIPVGKIDLIVGVGVTIGSVGDLPHPTSDIMNVKEAASNNRSLWFRVEFLSGSERLCSISGTTETAPALQSKTRSQTMVHSVG